MASEKEILEIIELDLGYPVYLADHTWRMVEHLIDTQDWRAIAIPWALRTWYRPDEPLYRNLLPTALGIAGEAGECIDLLKKETYKTSAGNLSDRWVKELGDLWYYIRIMFHQLEMEIPELEKFEMERGKEKEQFRAWLIDCYIQAGSILEMAEFSDGVIQKDDIGVIEAGKDDLLNLFKSFCIVIGLTSLDLWQLTLDNRRKLVNGKHGWSEIGKTNTELIENLVPVIEEKGKG